MKKEKEIITEYWNIRKIIQKDKNWGFDLSIKDFVVGMLFLTPQSYGTRLQNYIKNKIKNSKNVKVNEDKGDIVVNKNYIEIKNSLLTVSNDKVNIVQIRTYQKVDYYLCTVFDTRNLNDIKLNSFFLSKKDMLNEIDLLKATSAHGTKNAIKNNKNIEYRFSFKNNDENFNRWIDKYKINNFEEICSV